MIPIVPVAHRGFWKTHSEQNELVAFRRAFELGYGVETDLRDAGGRLVVSHDVPRAQGLDAEALFELYVATKCSAPLALNVKSDGLQTLLADALQRHAITNYFVFDMSVPETVRYVRRGFRCYTRESEYERHPSLYEPCAGVWMDQFLADWVTADAVRAHFERSKSVCVVSPELHGRNADAFWQVLRNAQSTLAAGESKFFLCTDAPDRAESAFRV